MGKLLYGEHSYELEDRLLAHLQVIVGMKLRRGENFFVTWRNPTSNGSGRQSLWIDNGLHLSFRLSIATGSRLWQGRPARTLVFS